MLLFLDESGTDHKEAPYEVLAGVALREKYLWQLIQEIRASERDHFGTLLSETNVEFKGKKLLKSKKCLARMHRSTRPEMESFGQRVFDLRYVGQRPSGIDDQIWTVYGITYIDDLRPKVERE